MHETMTVKTGFCYVFCICLKFAAQGVILNIIDQY